MSKSRNRLCRLLVAGTDRNGSPGFRPVYVRCSEGQYQMGQHYTAAEQACGLEPPLIVFEEADAPEWFWSAVASQFDWRDLPLQCVTDPPEKPIPCT